MVEEKTSRVVEVLLAKVPPARLLAGKVVGIGLLGFAQLLVLVAVGLVAVALAGSVDLPPGLAGAALSILGWFALGYAFTSCMFAVAGALASRMEELQNTAGVLNLVMVASFLVAVIGSGDPDGAVLRIGSFLPPSAPLCMPLRMANGTAEPWEVVLSVAVVLAATAVLVPIAGRVYRGGALETRRQVRLRQAWRGAAG
jgi:ABC-2 type transport system permease protein